MTERKLRDKALEAFRKTGLGMRSFNMFRKGYEARYYEENPSHEQPQGGMLIEVEPAKCFHLNPVQKIDGTLFCPACDKLIGRWREQ